MGIIEIAAIILFVVFIISVYYAEKDWSTWVGIGSFAALWFCCIVGFVTEPKQSKTIETTHPPQIDTIITIKNHIPDTTYVYTFIEKED